MKTTWKGTLQIGAMTIPVKMYAVATDQTIRFSWITPPHTFKDNKGKEKKCPGGTRVKQQLVCEKCKAVQNRRELKKGYVLSKTQIVVLEQGELDAVKLESLKRIIVDCFVPAETVNFLSFSKNIYLGPDELGERAFALVMDRIAGRVGIGRVVMKGKEWLVGIRGHPDGLVLSQLYFADEIRDAPEMPEVALTDKEKELGEVLVSKMTDLNPDLTQYTNRYRNAVKELIEAKLEGKEIAPIIEERKPEAVPLEKQLEQSIAVATS